MEQKPRNKMCPHCGSKMIAAAITKVCIVEVIDDPNNPFKVIKEDDKNAQIEVVKCIQCKKELKMEDLVAGVKCKLCGNIVSPEDLNEEGVCDVCDAINKRSELANASREDLIRMLLAAEKGVNATVSRVEKQIQKASQTEEKLSTEEQSQEKKSRKTKTRKEKEAENNIPSEAQEAVNFLADSQEAPFPEMNTPLPNDTNMSVSHSVDNSNIPEQPIGAGFEMFPADEEPF